MLSVCVCVCMVQHPLKKYGKKLISRFETFFVWSLLFLIVIFFLISKITINCKMLQFWLSSENDLMKTHFVAQFFLLFSSLVWRISFYSYNHLDHIFTRENKVPVYKKNWMENVLRFFFPWISYIAIDRVTWAH